ncbi:hypothetical protein DFQ27_005523 [Actinomortierella ambigua]|uniref:YTH domain-containing protein n=1 Tax=Actinomortierella ambigua TaxID=1343610 RepID=A0A9P6PYU7_9FUNG|nr:hypothetical protein DFQ27_005523 [Actinomortierella ambigua]
MGVGGMGGGVVPAVPTYGYPMPFYGTAMPPMYNAAGPRGQMGYPVPTGAQVPSMVPSRSLNPPPPPPLPHVQQHSYKHGYMGGGSGGGGGGGGGGSGGAYPVEYGGHYMPPGEHWHSHPPQQSLQKKPKELDKAMWVGNVSSDTTVADLQAIFEAPPSEEEGDIQVDVPESIFILSKSNCAFVNYATHDAVHRAVKRFHDREFKNTRLVCRPRKDPGSGTDSYGSRHGSSSLRYQPPSHQQHHLAASRPTSSLSSGGMPQTPPQQIPPPLPLPPPVHVSGDPYPSVQQQQHQSTAAQESEDREIQSQSTPGTDTTSMNMDSLRQELSPAPDSVSSGGGGGGVSATTRERDGRPRYSRPGRSLKHLSGLKSRSRSSSSSVHHSENRYYILKGLNEEDLKLSVQYGLWATQDHLVPVLNQAFANSSNVYLIFSANKSGEFFGYARMMDSISQEKHDHIFKSRAEANWIPSIAIPISPELKAEVARYIEEAEIEGRPITYEEAEAVAVESTPTKSWGIVFPVQWLFVHKVPFSVTSQLRNPYYDNREVKLSKDGTEVEPSVGEQLLSEFRKHRELKKSGSSGTSSASSPAGSESGVGGSRRSSIVGGGDKRGSTTVSPSPQIASLRRSSTMSNKSAESAQSSGAQASETPQLSASAVAKSPLIPSAQQGQQSQQQQQQQQISQQGSTASSVSPSPHVPSPQQHQQSSTTRKQGSGFYSHGSGSGHPRSHYTNPMQSGPRSGHPSGGGGGYRLQGQMQQQYGPGSYGGSHAGYTGHYGGQWQGKAGPRGNSGPSDYHPPGSTGAAGHIPTQNPTSPDHHHHHHHHHHQSSSSTNTLPPPSQQQQQQQPYYSPRRNQAGSRYYQQHPVSGGPYGGPSDGSYPMQYMPHPPSAGGTGYDYPAPSGGQYYNQSYPRRRNQGPLSGYRHTTDGHASGTHGSSYKHAGGPNTPGTTGTPDSAGQGYAPGPNSPPHGGYRMMHPMMNAAYPGMPPMMGYQFPQGQSFIPVPIAWHPSQTVPMQSTHSGDTVAAGTTGAGSGAKVGSANNSSNSSTNGNSSNGGHHHATAGGPGASGVPPVGGMAMMMGPQGYPGAAGYAPFPGMPAMAHGMSATGDVMMEGMIPTALGYDGVQYMYIPAEMADAYHQPMYYYGHMSMPAGVEMPMAAPLPPPSSGEGTLVSESVEDQESGEVAEEDEEGAGGERERDSETKEDHQQPAVTDHQSSEEGRGNGEREGDESEVSAGSPNSEQDSSASTPRMLAGTTTDGKDGSDNGSRENGSNGSSVSATITSATTAVSGAVPSGVTTTTRKTRKTKKLSKGSPGAFAAETPHS